MDIKVYTTPTCAYCHQAEEFLQSHGIDFTSIDVSQDQEAAKKMVEKTGQMGVPVIEIDDEFIIGFDVGKIKKALNI